MKELLFFLSILFLFSCQKPSDTPKEAKYCWTCRVTKTTYFTGGSTSLTTTVIKCDMSTSEKELFEQGSAGSAGSTTATCTKQ